MVEFSRRRLLGAVGAAAAAATIGGTAAGCSGSAGGSAGGDYDMPTYQPAPDLDVQPYFATEAPGMEHVYTEHPKTWFKSVDRGPGSGGKVTTFQLTWGDPSKPLEDGNQYWAELNERLGVSFEPQFVPQPVFDQKFATMLASGEVPDLVFVNDQTAANLQGIRDGAFADLSEVLSGDNILKWPNLAARKEEIWQASLKDGRIYQIPSPVWALTNLPVMRTDLVDQTGVGRAPADADQLLTMLKEVSALGSGPGGQQVYGLNKYDPIMWYRLFKVGPDWQLDDGELVLSATTDRYRQMLTRLSQAWAEGVFDPVAMTTNPADIISGAALAYKAVGETAVSADGFALWEKDLPGAAYDFFDMPGFDGSGQLVVRNIPYGKSTCVSAAAAEDEDRLTEILNVLDYLSAPFGSEEALFVAWGQEGRHYEFDANGIPVPTGDDLDELGVQYVGVTSGDNSYRVHPNQSAWLDSFVQVMESMAQHSIVRPLEGLEGASDTFVTKGAQLRQLWDDFERGVITGRESVDDLESFVDNFMSQGGTMVRDEYTQALKDAGK